MPRILLIVFWVVAFMPAASAIDQQLLTPFLENHCFECHDDVTAEGGLNLLDLSTDLSDEDLLRHWVTVHDRIRDGEMPPKNKPRPGDAEVRQLLEGLSGRLTEADRGRRSVVLRRLNREEYENTVNDLLGIEAELQAYLPEDTEHDGFDNVGSALGVSAELLEQYLVAADAALDEAIQLDERPETKRWETNQNLNGHAKRVTGKLWRKIGDGVVLFTSGYCPSVLNQVKTEAPGRYRIRIETYAFQNHDELLPLGVFAGNFRGSTKTHLARIFGVDWNEPRWVEFETQLDVSNTIQIRPIGLQKYTKEAATTKDPGIWVGRIEIEGPLLDDWPPLSTRNLLDDDTETMMRRFISDAFRRPATDEEVARYSGMVNSLIADERDEIEALRFGLKAVLTSPHFLFLNEEGAGETIDDWALASRLSYFFWSSAPDAELRDLAANDALSKPETMRAQVERMLADPKAERFIENFLGQWLDLRKIEETQPDNGLYPEFDEWLRDSMVAESQAFFRQLLNDDLSVLNVVDSDFAMLNERLAKHYGIEGVDGTEIRRVSLPDDSTRGGVLTQASVLKVTANGTNTSPVLRGVWILENIVGKPTNPPPPNVPAIEPDIRGAVTIREQLEKHRNVRSCRGCHAKIDPAGFALEPFDVIGGYRDFYRASRDSKVAQGIRLEDGSYAIYKRGPDVESDGIRAYQAELLEDPDQIARCLTEKLLTYATGRSLGFSDREAVEEIVVQIRDQNYGLRSLIHAIVQSDIFQSH
ncbi:MAG: DUF1592 domain-containing protein [Verrucomicrobiota bacterium]